jgi:predicted porin
MKKTLIALSVLVAAGSVNAATVYDNDGFALDVYGDAEIKYVQDIGANKEAYFKRDDADFGFNVSSKVNDEVSVIANIDFTGEGAVTLDDLTVGIKTSTLTAKVGDQVNLVDEIGISNDKAFGLDTAEDVVGLASSGEQVINVQYDSGEMFYAGFSTTTYADGDDTTSDQESQMAVKAGARFGDADVVVYYADGKTAADADVDVVAVKGSYSIDAVTLSAIYTTGSQESKDADAIGANISYSMDKTTLNFGYVDMDNEIASEDFGKWYANAQYAVAKNATVYVELGDSDATGADMGYATGLSIKF